MPPKIYHIVMRVTTDDQLNHFWDSSPMVLLKDYEYLRAGLTRIAEGYGGDVQSLAKSLLEGKV